MRSIVFNFRALAFYSLCAFWAALTFSNALTEITFVVSLVFWICYQLQRPSLILGPLPKSVWIPLAGFIILCLFSLLWSEYPKQSVRGIFKWLQQIMVFFMVIDIFRDEKSLSRFEVVFFGVLVLAVANGFYQYFIGKDFLRGFERHASNAGFRISGSFKTYGQLGAYLISTLPFLAALWRVPAQSKNVWWRSLLLGILLIAGLVVLFWTRSRGAFVAFGTGVIFFLFLKRKFIYLFLLMLAIGGAFFVLPKGMIIHMDIHGKEQSLVERYYLWDRAIQVIRAKPWGGTGINTYSAAHNKYDRTQNWRVRTYYAHNGYLQLAAETGLPSLFLFLFFLFQYFYQSLKKLKGIESRDIRAASAGLLVGVFNFLVLCLVDTDLHNPQPVMIFWFLLGIAWSYQTVSDAPKLGLTQSV